MALLLPIAGLAAALFSASGTPLLRAAASHKAGAATPSPFFEFTRGDGRKTLTGFAADAGGGKVIRLRGYGRINGVRPGPGMGYAGFEELKKKIVQKGADTVIELGGGDELRLAGVKASDLGAANFLFMDDITGPMAVHADRGWYVFNNSWGSKDLAYGKDYALRASFDPSSMATGTLFSWSYPPPSVFWTKVMGYPSVMFGADTFDNAPGAHDPDPVLPIQLADLRKMTTRYDVTFGGDTGGFDISYDLWLTRKPNGKWNDVSHEVMIWLHKGDLEPYGSMIGSYEEGEYRADLYRKDNYIALVPSRDHPAGTIDITRLLDALKERRLVTDEEYLNQIDLGAEPIRGKGFLRINHLSYDVLAYRKGGLVRKYVDDRVAKGS